jgi:type II secretory pathway predicted ATPase ExeA
MNYEIGGLTKEEGREYILEKLKSAGCSQLVFEDSAIEAVLNAADGTPRVINKLCNACLLIGDSSGSNLITSDIVMKAVNDSEL